MKIEVNIEKRYAYAIFGILFLALGILIVNAYGTSNPAVVGHSAGEIVEADPTVLASVKDGIAWSEISSRPAGLDDGDQVGLTSVPWSIITSRPAGLDDGDQVGISQACNWGGWKQSSYVTDQAPCLGQLAVRLYCSGGIITDIGLVAVPGQCA